MNHKKCETLIFNFSKKVAFPPNIQIGSSDIIKEVDHAKMLGLVIQTNLQWNLNTEYIFNKAASKLWLLRRLKHFNLDAEILTDFYIKEVRIILEYAVPVWFSGITKQQSKHLEKIQRWATSVILNNWTLSYRVRCTLLGLTPLYLRRKSIALAFSLRTSKNPKHTDFFIPKCSKYNTRHSENTFEEYKVRSSRFQRSPLVTLTTDLNIYLKQAQMKVDK